MTTPISTRAELRLAIEKLTVEQAIKEQKLKENTRLFANQFKPANIIKTVFRSVTHDKDMKNDFMAKGVDTLLGLFLPGLLLKKSGPVLKVAATIIGSGIASSILGGDANKYVDKAKVLFDKLKTKFSKTEDDQFNEQDLY